MKTEQSGGTKKGKKDKKREGRPSGSMDGAELARRIDSRSWQLTVADATALTPSVRRISLTSTNLAELAFVPGQDLMFTVPGPDGRLVRRRYTIRSLDPEVGLLVIDVVLHGDGPGARWAAQVGVGQTVEAVGPRGKVTPRADADWHLFVGDESFAPAALAMAEALAPAEAPAGASSAAAAPSPLRRLRLLVDGPEDEHPTALDGEVDMVWLHRRPGVSDGTLLVEAVESLSLPSGTGHAYLGGEKAAVGAARQALAGRGIGSDAVSAKSYWRAGRAEAADGEPGDH